MIPTGVILIVLGILGAIWAFAMKVTAPFSDVVNLDLLSQRILVAIFAAASFIAGAVLTGFGVLEETTDPERRKRDQQARENERLKTSIAAEKAKQIELEAQKARDDRMREAPARRARRAQAMSNFATSLRSIPVGFDNTLRRMAGSENALLYRFLQVLFYLMLPALIIAAVLLTRG